MFKPLLAGFQGSKRYPQIQIGKRFRFGSSSIETIKIALEDRLNRDGVVIGINKTSTGEMLANSGITAQRKMLPAVALNLSMLFKTPFNPTPSKVFSFFEIQQTYLYYDGSWHRKYPYVFGLGAKIGMNKVVFEGEYIHSKGLIGVAGLRGNNLKTFSYIYNGSLITRESDALCTSVSLAISKNLSLVGGFGYVRFKNFHHAKYFLPFEVENVRTYYIDAILKTTNLTQIFIQLNSIRTKYLASQNKTENPRGTQVWLGYRYYF